MGFEKKKSTHAVLVLLVIDSKLNTIKLEIDTLETLTLLDTRSDVNALKQDIYKNYLKRKIYVVSLEVKRIS